MKSSKRYPQLLVLLLVLLAVAFASGCRSTRDTSTDGAAGVEASDESLAASSQKGGAQLWVENCMRCHNIRDPKSLSDSEWQVAVHHMRVRANLTANEHKQIVAFLKSAN